MIQFQTTSEEVKSWFPKTYEMFIDELRNSKSVYNDTPEEKINWFMSWGFFGRKPQTEEERVEKNQKIIENMALVYDERIQKELPKIKCEISIVASNYYRNDRSIDEGIPSFIADMAKEIVKIMMLQEQNYFPNSEVMQSLQQFPNLFQSNSSSPKELVLDEILEKIHDHGMSSLTPEEIMFLEQKSKSK